MANVIQIKRRATSGTAGPASSLRSGEQFYNMADGYLYIGYGDDGLGNATSPKAIGHHDFNINRMIPAGGTAGQVLRKVGPTNFDVEWGSIPAPYTIGFGLDLTGQSLSVDTGEIATTQALNTGLGGKSDKGHTHVASDVTDGVFDILRIPNVPAAKITGVLDPSQIPILPSQQQVVSSGGIANLTVSQQNDIVSGTIVTTTDGSRWVYTGTGSKTAEASYIAMGDVTPEWAVIANKPTFAAVATSGSYNDLLDRPTLGSLAALNSINNANWSGTALALTNGGTGATTAAAARTNLGLVIGTNVQAYNVNLAALSGVTGAADRGVYYTSATTMAVYALTAFGRTLAGAADAAAARTSLGLGTMAQQHANNVSITGGTVNGVVIDCGEV